MMRSACCTIACSALMRMSGSHSLMRERLFTSASVWNIVKFGTPQRAFSRSPTTPESQ